jgi:6-phosphofructokinase 2
MLAQEESISFEAIETRSGTRENFVADDNTNSQFRFVFRHHRYNR